MSLDEQYKHELMSTLSLIVDPEKLLVEAVERMTLALDEWEFNHLTEFLESIHKFRELVDAGTVDSWADYVSGAHLSPGEDYYAKSDEDFDLMNRLDYRSFDDNLWEDD